MATYPYREAKALKDITSAPPSRLATPGAAAGRQVADIAEARAGAAADTHAVEQEFQRRDLREAALGAKHETGLAHDREVTEARLGSREAMHEEEIDTSRTVTDMDQEMRSLEVREARAQSERATLFALAGQAVNLVGVEAKRRQMNQILDKYTAREKAAEEQAAYYEELTADYGQELRGAIEDLRKSFQGASAPGSGG